MIDSGLNWWMKFLIALLGVLILIRFYRQRILDDWNLFRLDKKRWLYLKWKNWGEPILLAVVLALFVRTYFVQAFKIPTGSMRPIFIENDRILVDKISYRFREPKRGDIIVFKYPQDRKKDFVKRLIAFGEEKVRIDNGQIFINGERLKAPESISQNFYYNRDDWPYGQTHQDFEVLPDHFFVLGDNSIQSSDSRNWGFVPKKNLIGRSILIYWPPQRVKWIPHGAYIPRPTTSG